MGKKTMDNDPLAWLEQETKQDGTGTQCLQNVQGVRRVRRKRQTYWLTPQLIQKLRDISYWQRCGISDLVEQVLARYVEESEARRGQTYPLRPR